MIVACPGGNMYATGNPLAIFIALILTMSMVVIGAGLLRDCKSKKWRLAGIISLVIITILNVITFAFYIP